MTRRELKARRRCYRRFRGDRAGMAALEVIMTTVITLIIFAFITFWTMRLSLVVFSVIGEMVGSPLV